MAQHTDGNITYTVSLEMKELLENSRRVIKELEELNGGSSRASRGLDRLETSSQNAGNSLGKLTKIAKTVSAELVSNTVIGYAQSWNELEDRIQNTGATASQTKDILDQLLATSNRNGRTIEESVELYIRLSNSMGELGYSTQSTLSYIGSMSDLFTINKTSAIGTESAINALTKAQMEGKLAGVEAMTVFSKMPSVLGILTNYLKKNAKSTADAEKITEQYVKQLASDGKLSIQTFNDALIDSNVELDALADNMRKTVTEGLNSVINNLKKYFGELNNSTGATKLLVDSLFLMSQNVDILMTGVGALAAIYAGKYITSLASATKQSAEQTIANIRQAQAEKVLIQAEMARISENIRALEVQKQNIILAQTHCNSLRAQMTLNNQLAVVETQLTAATNQQTAAQARLDVAMKASSFAANGLRSAMALLGGPAGILFLVAGGIMSFASKAKDATPQIREYTKSIDQMKESLKELNQVQLKGKIADLKDEAKAINKEISELNVKVRCLKKAQETLQNPAYYIDNFGEYLAAAFQGTPEEIHNELDKLYAKIEEKQNNLKNTEEELKLATDQYSSSISGATKSTENLLDSLGEAARNKLNEKIRSLSAELEIAKLKQKGLNKEAYVAQALLSSLGDNAGKYQSAILNAAKNGKLFNDSIKGLPDEIQPLIMKLAELWDVTKQGASTINNTEASIKNLSTELQIAKCEAQGLIDKANELKAIQALGLDSSNSEQLSSNEAQIEQMKLLIEQQNQLNLAKNGMDIAKQEIDSRADPVELLKNELKEKQIAINEAHEQGLLSEQQYNDAITAAKQNAADKQKKIEDDLLKNKLANVSSMLSASSDMFGRMADLTRNFAGESSSAYKALFAISKGFAIANATLNLQTALSNASTAPYPTNIAAYAQAATQGAQIISAISSMSYGGARKNGGPVDANSMYRVGEGGKPEILMAGGKQYLIPGENGRVLSNRQITSNQGQNIQWNFIVENYASGVEVSKPSIDYENKIIRTAVKQAKQEVADDIKEHTGEVWRAMSNSTNIQSKL
ncbi:MULTISPECIES: tape measure protein [unclassified Gilliamella]|uniref:tape measure protein n=3 Tax=Gilliamella TaxID=1193503 RepID=UPI00226AD097|nr:MULTISPECIES: tape measure protein [unclassified Gilliamella]MCX8602421.1 hypothetical protein [Gilliamella sp. B3722]MCX8611824.1 hypothetical protein [Gilliamella sp. B3891]MCX8614053.1 hypothetical protein [Gilliamella sp. B3773]MCX8621321.1 hypothetical protein [Gilliamella sp. B3892]MCX8623979.1 hypothetical protein [Gilliamella sp. B3759]